MGCCGSMTMAGFDFDAMCQAEKKVKQFEKDFIEGFEVDHLRKVLKKLRKQYHIEEIAYSGDRGWYFDPSSGDMVQWNSGYKYRVRYWHFDPAYSDREDGKVKHFYCF